MLRRKDPGFNSNSCIPHCNTTALILFADSVLLKNDGVIMRVCSKASGNLCLAFHQRVCIQVEAIIRVAIM